MNPEENPGPRTAPSPKKTRMAMTPLVLIGIFVSFTEVIAGTVLLQSEGNTKIALTVFVCVFPFAIFGGFFGLLWARPFHLYPPPETTDMDGAVKYMKAVTHKGTVAQETQSAIEAPIINSPLTLVHSKNDQISAVGQRTDPQPKEEPDLQFKMMKAYIEKKGEIGDRFFSEALELEKDIIKKDKLRLWRAYLKFTFLGVSESLTEILKLCKSSENEVKLSALNWAGVCYNNIKDFSNAIACNTTAIEIAEPKNKPQYIATLAGTYANDGQTAKAIDLICNSLSEFSEPEAQATLYAKLSSIFEGTDQHELCALAAEKALQYRPTDETMRFAAGYAYSNSGHKHLTVFHYEALIDFKRDHAMALNNLGVAYQGLTMPIKAISRYKQSFEKDNSLAGANLANVLIDIGFAELADETLEKAKAMKDPHQNVSRSIVTLSVKREEEAKQQKAVLKSGRDQQRFLREYADAYFLKLDSNHSKFQGTWTTKNGDTIHVSETHSSLSAQWHQDGVTFKMTGKVTNRSAIIEVLQHIDKTDVLSLLGSSPKKGYAYINTDRTEMAWMTMDGTEASVRSFHLACIQPALPEVS